jgi:hypothetical protein
MISAADTVAVYHKILDPDVSESVIVGRFAEVEGARTILGELDDDFAIANNF